MTTFIPGRLPEDRSRPRLRLAPHVATDSAPPSSADWYSAVPEWGGEGNDLWGDCVFAGNAHIVEQQTALGDGSEVAVSTQQALAEYSRVTGFDPNAGPPQGGNPTDKGALIQDGLADLRRNGLAGVKIAAFARVDQSNQDEVRTALAEFGAMSIGVNLPASAMRQFDAGEPWTVVPDDGGILGGHCVVAVGYDPAHICIVTWGKVVAVAWEWFAKYCDEAWAVVSQAWAGKADPTRVNAATLGAEFAALTGEPDPFAAPAPSPAPPLPHVVFVSELIGDLRAALDKAEHWLEQHL